MIHPQGKIPKRWILACIFLLLLTYFYHHTPAVWKSPPSEQRLQKPSREPEKGVESGIGSGASASQTLNGSIEGLESWIYDPYPKYNTPEWRKEWKGNHVSCMGPRGVPVNGEADDMLMAHRLPPDGPSIDPFLGSYEDTGLNTTVCFSSSARYRPYGYSEDGDDHMVRATDPSNVLWEDVNWGALQTQCILSNQNRYDDVAAVNQSMVFRYAEYADVMSVDETLHFPNVSEQDDGNQNANNHPEYKKRTAVVFEVEESREWTLDTTQYVRSMIMELSLHTGGEYEVIILIEVVDDAEPIFNNPGVHHKVIERSVPREFQNISFLFNRKLLQHWYSKVPRKKDEGLPSHTYAPLQLLSLARPDIEFFWLMDVDARYTGHHYDHLEKISSWSKFQSREVLWELASQLYVREAHKSWEKFVTKVKKAARAATIRGPLRTKGIEPVGPQPPLMLSGKDRWGVGEDADLITLGPVLDVAGSLFEGREDVSNYPDGVDKIPRRATAFPSMTRTSKRLLRAMHYGQVTMGLRMPPSMFPASTALHHGLKVVAFPLPIFFDATISPQVLEEEWNTPDWGRHTYDKPYRYKGFWRWMTFAIAVDDEPAFADETYRRWLGYDASQTRGLCLPGLLLHPIQGV